MDKQKQIEEMAKVIEEAMAKARRTLGGHNNIAMFYATMLVNAGYRKIAEGGVIEKNKAYKYMRGGGTPENAVVLTEDEYERWQGQTLNIKKVRKETAEKFVKEVDEFFKPFDKKSPIFLDLLITKIENIAKKVTED